jgi:glycosyltransferase involved in cell wall biosynthesis
MAGESKYPLKKMLAFALDGITSFSVTPIRFVTLSGILLFLLSLIAGCYTLVSKWFGTAVSGWSSLMLSLWFIGGIQLLALGLIGEYIGKIYREVKRRPLYIVEKELAASGKTAVMPVNKEANIS